MIAMVQKKTNTTVTIIGEILARSEGRWIQSADGKNRPLASSSWDHLK
jgi:hypothetical protein